MCIIEFGKKALKLSFFLIFEATLSVSISQLVLPGGLVGDVNLVIFMQLFCQCCKIPSPE